MTPRVTVIIPTYNWPSVLPYSVGSALDQTFTDFEILVVGDGCTDHSDRVVAAIEDSRVRWINLQPRTGHQYGPNNEGLRQAAGEIVAYLGHDDLWLPHHLALAVAAIDEGADLVHSMAIVVDPHGRFVPPLTETRAGWIAPSCVVHRRSITTEIGGWRDYRELNITPEHDLWRRARATGYRFTFTPRVTAVKFSASLRRNVYREQPCHEQAQWLARIRSEPDFEAVELAKSVVQLKRGPAIGIRLWQLLREPSQWPARVWRRKGARITARQRFKGVKRPA